MQPLLTDDVGKLDCLLSIRWSGRAKAEPWLTACCPLCGSRSRKYNYGAHVNCWFGPSI
ncbi:hypothetical protein Hanom_Chr12g01081531 [Helianthus anomalus]